LLEGIQPEQAGEPRMLHIKQQPVEPLDGKKEPDHQANHCYRKDACHPEGDKPAPPPGSGCCH
jgi:hypothetical protein